MNFIYLIAAIITFGVLIYLICTLLKGERMS